MNLGIGNGFQNVPKVIALNSNTGSLVMLIEFFNLALTDRNILVKFGLKRVLES